MNKNSIGKYFPKYIKLTSIILWALGVSLTVLPIVYMFFWSLWGTSVVGQLREFSGVTLKWFFKVFNSSEWRQSLSYSVILAMGVSFTGVIINSIYYYVIGFTNKIIDSICFTLNALVLLTPLIIYGLSLGFVGSYIGVGSEILMFFGHLAWIIPLQFLVFEAFRDSVPPEMIKASKTMGASDTSTFIHVFCPVARIPILSSFTLGFFLSFDEVVIANYVIDGPNKTVPLKLWKEQSHTVDPDSAVVTVSIVIIVLFIIYTFQK